LFRKVIILIAVLLFPLTGNSQTGREKRAAKFIKQQRYNSAFVLLNKSLQKDRGNLAALYLLAQYYATPGNADYHLDSAYRYALKAVDLWQTSGKARKKWNRFPGDSTTLVKLRSDIESSAFTFAQQQDTEVGYADFIRRFPYAGQLADAHRLMEEAAYNDAMGVNTYEAFLTFLNKYPASFRAADARERYERLLFETRTSAKTLAAYIAYLKENPSTPYRNEVERNIFEISTADGSAKSFADYLSTWGSSSYAARARAILRHLANEDLLDTTAALHQDTTTITEANRFLVPFLEKGKFGFMNQSGQAVLAPTFEDIDPGYLCGNITEDVIVADDKVFSSDGAPLYHGAVSSVDDLGCGFLRLESDSGITVLHKGGSILPDKNLEDADVLAGRMLALKKNGRWALFTLAGRRLIDYEADEIFSIGDVFVFRMDKKYTLSTSASVAAIADGHSGKFTEAFDEVKKVFDNNIWIRLGKFEGVLDQRLQILIKVDSHRVSPTYFGAVAESHNGYSTFNRFGEESEYFRQLQVINPWVAARTTEGSWLLFDPVQRIAKSIPYDSVAVHGPFAVGISKETVEIHVHRKDPPGLLVLPRPDRTELLSAQDTVSYLMLENRKKMDVYGQGGEKLFSVSYDKIQAAGSGFFIVWKKEKKGLIDSKGKIVLPVEYDAIGMVNNGLISLLKSMKFGLYDCKRKKLIKPEYEKNIAPYAGNIFTVFRNGSMGFIDINNKLRGKIEFTEVKHWTDSVALVKNGGSWKLFNLYTLQPELEGIEEFKVIREDASEKLFIIKQNGLAGVLSNRKGIVIPISFSDVVNVGSAERPVYFTEKHVQEASIFVVIYYNHQGVFLRKEVYEQDDYERIYCNK
jgi:hypothetical protein